MALPLVVAGSVNADVYCELMRLPRAGETVAARGYAVRPGGKGANQAAAASKLDYPTRFVGRVGKDANATLVMDALTNCGVDVLNVRGVESPTGTAIILLQPSGENSIIIVGGANQDWGEIDREIKESIGMAGALLLQREIPEEVNIELAKIANSSSVPVYLDAGGIDEPVSDDLISLVDVISPNETELARLTGLATDTDEGVKLAVEKLKTKGISKVLVKMGAKGSILFTPDYEIYQAAVPAPEVVDTTGAGDCFTAAFVVSILEGHDERTALTFAATAASLCIRKIGALPSLPTRKEVEEEYQHKE